MEFYIWQNQKQYIALNVVEKLLHGMGVQQSIYLQSVRNETNWLFTMLKMKMWKSKKFHKGKHQVEKDFIKRCNNANWKKSINYI